MQLDLNKKYVILKVIFRTKQAAMQKKTHKPLYKSLAEKLCDRIAAEKLAEGDFFSTIKEISNQYNVAILTVRRAIEVLQNQGVIFCKPACGIFIKSIAALDTLRARKNFILIIDDHSDNSVMTSYSAMRLCSILEILSDAGYSVKVANSDEITEKDLFSMKELISGIIISSSRAKKYPAFFNDKSAPPVAFTRRPKTDFKAPSISYPSYDNEKLFQMGCDYFNTHGKKKIVIINFDYADIKMEHIKAHQGLPLISDFFPDSLPSVTLGQTLAPTLDIDSETGILVQDDFTALGIYNFYLARGRDLFKEKALLAAAGPTVRMTEQLGLPVIGFCPRECGRAIANALINTINKESHTSPVITPKANKNV